jgi:hypothetical protein
MDNKKKYDIYLALIKENLLSKDNILEELGSNYHIIMRKVSNRVSIFQSLMGVKSTIPIARIVSEPTFAKGFAGVYRKCEGLKIQILNPYNTGIFKEFIKVFKNTFPDEKVELV